MRSRYPSLRWRPRAPYRRGMAIYEYLCLACEHPFEERRPMDAGSVDHRPRMSVVRQRPRPPALLHVRDRRRRRRIRPRIRPVDRHLRPDRADAAVAAAPVAAESGDGSVNGVRGGVTEAAHVGDERTTLTGFLQRQRDLVAWKLRGSDDGTLRSVGTASGLTAARRRPAPGERRAVLVPRGLRRGDGPRLRLDRRGPRRGVQAAARTSRWRTCSARTRRRPRGATP